MRNYEAIDKELRTCGFFPNCGDRFQRKRRRRFWKSTAAGIHQKSFDNLKNELDMKRMRSHSSKTAQGKVFVIPVL